MGAEMAVPSVSMVRLVRPTDMVGMVVQNLVVPTLPMDLPVVVA